MNIDQAVLTEKEWKLIKLLRKVKFGKVVVHQENCQPVRVESVESIKL